MKDKRQSWHRHERESEQEYNFFLEFLRERNVTEIAKKYYADRGQQGLETGRTYIQHIKREFQWDQRVRAYDYWLAKQKDDAIMAMVRKEVSDIRKKRVKILQKVATKVNKAVDSVRDENIKDTELFKVNMLVDIVAKMDGLWRKFEESNPISATAEKPFEKEAVGMQEKLIAMIEQSQKKLQEVKPEIIQ